MQCAVEVYVDWLHRSMNGRRSMACDFIVAMVAFIHLCDEGLLSLRALSWAYTQFLYFLAKQARKYIGCAVGIILALSARTVKGYILRPNDLYSFTLAVSLVE